MDFDDTPEEAAFRGEARAWLDAHAELLEPGERPPSPLGYEMAPAQRWMAEKADAGWACISWPRVYGGRDATPIQSVIWAQEEARYRVPPNLFVIGQGMLGPTLITHGTEAQKKRFLPALLRADEIWSQLFSEPGAGSDLGGLRTAALREGDTWVLNGQKTWSSMAQHARWGMILTRTDPMAAKHAGITYFVVDLRTPGVEIRPIQQMNGESDFNEIFFHDVRVPDENRIGEVNDGWRCAITTLMNERVALAGGSRYSIRERDLLQLLWESELRNDSWARQRVAAYYIKLRGLEYLRYRSLTALSRGQTPGPESSVSKMVAAPLRQELTSFAVEVQGPAGVTQDFDLTPAEGYFQSGYLAIPGGRIAGGSDEILHNIVAERVLGLPAEIRVDKDIAFQDIPTGPP